MTAANVVTAESPVDRPLAVWIEDGEGTIVRGVAESVTRGGAHIRLSASRGRTGEGVALRICFDPDLPTVATSARVSWVRSEGEAAECAVEWTGARATLDEWLASRNRLLPDLAALLGRPHHRRVRRAANAFWNSGRFESGPMTRYLPIGCGSPWTISRCVSGADRVAAELAPGDEELLLGREAVDRRRGRLALARLLEGAVGDLRPGEVADRLAEHQLAVVVDAGLDRSSPRTGRRRTARAAWNFFRSAGRPPVREPALRVVLRALVVEAVADLVADDDADRAVVHRVGRVHVEGRRLEDAGREHDLVEQRVVVRVRGRRRHAPAAAVDGLADLRAVVVHVERRPATTFAQNVSRAIVDLRVVLPLVRDSRSSG